MDELNARIEKLEDRQIHVETRLAVAESNIKDIRADITSIKNNTTWILRLIIGSVIVAILGLIIKGGL